MRCSIPVAAVALLCTATLALAQGPQDRPQRGGQDRGERAGPQREPGGAGMQQGGSPRAERREQAEPRVQQERSHRPSAAERSSGIERRSAERERVQRDGEQRRAQQQQERRRDRADRGDRNTERRQVERRETEQRQAERPDRVKRSKEREDRADRVRERRDDRGEQRADRGNRAERRQAAREARTRLTQEQRTRFHNSFDRRHVTNVNIRVRIGTRIPRSVRLYPIPAVVVGFVPAYSYYRYVYVDDTICIVDPDTYEIVDVIEYGSGGPAILEARLDLTDWERDLILDSIGADFPEAEIDLRLALGAEVPGPVELHRFPDVVLDRMPKIRPFRFAVSDGDVVIVDPRDREIELVVRR